MAQQQNNSAVSDVADFDEVEAITLPVAMPATSLIGTDEDDLFTRMDVEIEATSTNYAATDWTSTPPRTTD